MKHIKSLTLLVLALVFTSQTVWAEGMSSETEIPPASLTTSKAIETSSVGAQNCTFIDFEGISNLAQIGVITGNPNVTFNFSWRGLIDSEAGGSGNFSNEPSPDTTAFFLQSVGPIDFDTGVQFMEVFYVASAISVPVTLTAWDGPNGTGNVVDTAIGSTVGRSTDGANCTGDPTGEFCLWDVITLTTATNNIQSITLTGATANEIGFDNMTYCTFNPNASTEINIKKGSNPNSINTCSGGTTPVTIWGSDTFDVNKVNLDQLSLASAMVKTVGKADKTLCSFGDEGSKDDAQFDSWNTTPDGFVDLTCHFVTTALDLNDVSSSADLHIVGCDDATATGDPDLCEASDPGFFDVTATDSVNIVKTCP